MKKGIAAICILILIGLVFAGCSGQNAPADGQAAEGEDAGTGAAASGGGITLEDMRRAAEDSGYTVGDEHSLFFMTDVKDGFSVQIVADGQDTVYSVLECGSEDAAIKNAQEIDDAGYNIAIRNGRFLTCYGVENKDGAIKDILTSILNGEKAAN